MTNRNDHHFYRQQPSLCRCAEPFGDERQGTCARCGRQVEGYEIPSAGAFGIKSRDESTFARKTRKYGPAW